MNEPLTNDQRALRVELITLACEILHAKGIPVFEEESFFCVTTPKRERYRMIDASDKTQEQCRVWAIKLKALADKLR